MPSKSLFPQFCGRSVIKSYWPSKSHSLGFLSPFARAQVGKSVLVPRTFTTVQEHLVYSPVCRSSAQQLYSGANDNLLQEDLCYMPHLPGLLQPEPLSPQQVTADPCLCWRHLNTQRQIWFSLLWRSLLLSLGPGEHKALLEPSENI